MRKLWCIAIGASLLACSASDSGQSAGDVETANPGASGQSTSPSRSWVPYNEGLNGATIVDVLFDTRALGVVYATGANTVYQSTDSGQTWHAQGHFDPAAVGYLALVGDSPNDLLATSGSGLIRSSNAGKTWQQVALDGLNVSSLSVHPTQPLRVYVGLRGSGVFRSDDGGKTWTAVTDGYPYMDTLAVQVDPTNPDVVVAGGILLNQTDSYSNEGVVMRTTDGGQSWQTVLQGDGNIWNVTRCPSNPTVLYAAADMGVVRSHDSGQTWTLFPTGTTIEDVAITPAACDEIFAMAYGQGPLHSTDGAQTFGSPLMSGLQLNPVGTWPGRVAVDPQHAGSLVLGSHGGIWFTTNAGSQWSTGTGVLGMVISALNTSPMDPARLWLTSWGSGLWRRPSPSQPWERVAALPADYTFAAAAHPFMPNRVLVSSWSTLYQSSDGTEFTADPLSENAFAFAFDSGDASVIYAATQLNGVYKSTDGGSTWTAANNGLTPWNDVVGQPAIDVWSIAIDPAEPTTLYIGTNGRGAYKSTDGAQSWKNVFAPNQQISCLSLTAGPNAAVFACVHGAGVQSTSDGGATWTDVSDGLPTLDVNGLVSDAATGDLYATSTAGVFVKHGAQSWVGVDLAGAPGKGASAPAIVVDGTSRSLVVAAGGGVYAYEL